MVLTRALKAWFRQARRPGVVLPDGAFSPGEDHAKNKSKVFRSMVIRVVNRLAHGLACVGASQACANEN